MRTARLLGRLAARDGAPADVFPVPPERLRALVAGNVDVLRFLAGADRDAQMIEGALRRHGVRMSDLRALLDFGCGCGRIIRRWSGLQSVDVHGTDYNAELVRWCTENLPFAHFARNELEPPLPYPDGRFDFVYAFSVFTHLPQELQRPWMEELTRVLSPGGHLLFTVHGSDYLDKLPVHDLERFRRGELVVRRADAGGTNLCAAFHPLQYVREKFARELEILEHVPGYGKYRDLVPRYHDVYLARKP